MVGHSLNRIASDFGFPLGRRLVQRLVVRIGVRVRTCDARVYDRGALAGTHVRDGFAHRREAGEEVGAVDRVDVHSRKRPQQPGNIAAGSLRFDWDGDGVAVVFDQKQDGEMPQAGGVHRLPELAFARRAVAGGHVDDLVTLDAAAQLGVLAFEVAVLDQRLGRTHGLQELGPGRTRLRHDVEPLASPVRRHLAAAGVGIRGGAGRFHQDLRGRHPESEAERESHLNTSLSTPFRPAGSSTE